MGKGLPIASWVRSKVPPITRLAPEASAGCPSLAQSSHVQIVASKTQPNKTVTKALSLLYLLSISETKFSPNTYPETVVCRGPNADARVRVHLFTVKLTWMCNNVSCTPSAIFLFLKNSYFS